MISEKKKQEGNTTTEIKVFTYGGPEVGNDEFVKLFKSLPRVKCYQTINNLDVVPRLAHITNKKYSTDSMGELFVYESHYCRLIVKL